MLRFGIIGCGVIAPYHARALSVIEGAELYAVCDIVEEKAVKLAEQFGVGKIYKDYMDLLQDENIDVVCICTPSGMHGEMCINAARAKKHILCEKPIEITKEKMDAIIKSVDESGVKMGCVYQRRMQTNPMKVKAALDKGEFGKVLIADAYLKYHRTPEYYKSADWRATWELDGGGSLMNQGVHGVDLINWFMGGIDSINAIVRTQRHDIDVEDSAVCTVKYSNGAIGVIESSTCVYPAQDSRFEIHCEKGSIIFSDAGMLQWERIGESPEALQKEQDDFSGSSDPTSIGAYGHTPIVRDLIDAITTDREPAVSPREARKAVDVILAIYESSKKNKEIFINK